jgi:alpha-ribazole phosphatase
MRLILVRHPQPLVTAGICYGSTDVPVAPGVAQRAAAALHATLPIAARVYSSPLQRCAALATRLSHPTLDARLAEMDFGRWEMQPWHAIPKAEIDAWAADLIGYRPGGGESVLEFTTRVASFYDDMHRVPDEAVVVICHAGTMRVLAACQAGLPLAETAMRAAQMPHSIAYEEQLLLHL